MPLVPRIRLAKHVRRACKAHAFVEDCPCGCEGYFVFARNERTDEVFLAFGEQRDADRFEVISLGPAQGLTAVHEAAPDPHTWAVVGRVMDVLVESDGAAVEVVAQVVELRPTEAEEEEEKPKKRAQHRSERSEEKVPGGTSGGTDMITLTEVESEQLDRVLTRYLGEARAGLTPSEQSEVRRLIRGFACKEAAADAEISTETVRARRKRIYRKLGTDGAHAFLSEMLALAFTIMAEDSGRKSGASNTVASNTATAPGGVRG